MVGGRGRDRTGDPLLAKQVLSQLSYTPTVGTTFILKHFRRFQNPFLRFSSLDFEQLHQGVKEFIDQYYNRCRLHSALCYQSPEGFESQVAQARPDAIDRGPMVTFFNT